MEENNTYGTSLGIYRLRSNMDVEQAFDRAANNAAAGNQKLESFSLDYGVSFTGNQTLLASSQ